MMTGIQSFADAVGLLLWFYFLTLWPLIAVYAAYGWFTGRGLFRRGRVEPVLSAAAATARRVIGGGAALLRTPAAGALWQAALPWLPYAGAGAVAMVLTALFPPLAALVPLWALWAARGYDRILVLLGLATVAICAQDVATLIVWATLGLGFPLLFVGTVFCYALAARPAARAMSGLASRPVRSFALSALAILAFAVLPGLAGRWQAWRGVLAYRAQDHVPPQPPALRSLEIRRPASSYDGTFEDGAACGHECRSVLEGGGVDWVRVVMSGGSSTVHKLASAGACAGAARTGKMADACVVIADDSGAAADLELAIVDIEPFKAGYFDVVAWSSTHAAVATRLEGGRRIEILRQTGAAAEIPYMPAIIFPKFRGMDSGGAELWRWTDASQAISLTAALRALGFAVSPADEPLPRRRTWEDAPDAGMDRAAAAVLDLSQAGAFNSEQARMLAEWVSAARQIKTWTPDQVALLRRIAQDRRMRGTSDFGQIFAGRPEIATALLPDVLDLLEAQGAGKDDTAARQAAYRFDSIDPALLGHYAKQIRALLDKDGDLRRILLRAAGRIGIDPSPYLLPFAQDIGSAGSLNAYSRLHGACVAEMKWAPGLVPDLRDAVAINERRAKPDPSFQQAALKTLAKLGDADFARQYLARRGDENAKRLSRRIEDELARPRGEYGLCRD